MTRNVYLFSTALVALALYGCGTMPFAPPEGHYKCTSDSDCVVTVSVVDDNGKKVKVDRPHVDANGYNITWNAPSGYTFPSDGINPKWKWWLGGNDPKDVLTCKAASNARFQCTNSKARGNYAYAVKVQGAGDPPELDPWIHN
jgi:hypothetical protein